MHRLSSGAAGTLEALSPSPVNIRRRRTRACQTNTRVSYDEKNFTVLAAAIVTWLVFFIFLQEYFYSEYFVANVSVRCFLKIVQKKKVNKLGKVSSTDKMSESEKILKTC